MSKELIYGIHAIKAVLAKRPAAILNIYVQANRKDARMNEVLDSAKRLGVSIQSMEKSKLDKRANHSAHQGIIAEIKAAQMQDEKALFDLLNALKDPALLLVLDGVQDPHNLGACLRSADAAGAHAVIIPKNKAASLTPVARKVACGAAETIPVIQVTNLARTLKDLQEAGVWFVGTAGEAEGLLYNIDLTGPIGIIMGAEGDGMRQLTRKHCDYLAKLPMQGSVSSLNVSVAAGIALFEAVRQRLTS